MSSPAIDAKLSGPRGYGSHRRAGKPATAMIRLPAGNPAYPVSGDARAGHFAVVTPASSRGPKKSPQALGMPILDFKYRGKRYGLPATLAVRREVQHPCAHGPEAIVDRSARASPAFRKLGNRKKVRSSRFVHSPLSLPFPGSTSPAL